MSKRDISAAMQIAYGHRDKNEAKIVEFIRASGYHVSKMLHTIGYDLLLEIPNQLVAVEIKNPEERWSLTDNEIETRVRYAEMNIPYVVFEYKEQAADFLGVPIQTDMFKK